MVARASPAGPAEALPSGAGSRRELPLRGSRRIDARRRDSITLKRRPGPTDAGGTGLPSSDPGPMALPPPVPAALPLCSACTPVLLLLPALAAVAWPDGALLSVLLSPVSPEPASLPGACCRRWRRFLNTRRRPISEGRVVGVVHCQRVGLWCPGSALQACPPPLLTCVGGQQHHRVNNFRRVSNSKHGGRWLVRRASAPL